MKNCLDFSGAKKAMEGFQRELLRTINLELEVFQEDVKDEIQHDNSFKGGARLKARLKYRIDRRRATTSTDINHARFLEYGTKPHIIRARRKKSLMFYQNGVKLFRKQVAHPGQKATHFMQNAHNKAFLRFQQNLSDRLSVLSKRF